MAERKVWTMPEWEALTPDEQRRLLSERVELRLEDLTPEFRERIEAKARTLAEKYGVRPETSG